MNQLLNTKTVSARIWQQERGADAVNNGTSYLIIKSRCYIGIVCVLDKKARNVSSFYNISTEHNLLLCLEIQVRWNFKISVPFYLFRQPLEQIFHGFTVKCSSVFQQTDCLVCVSYMYVRQINTCLVAEETR